jgi:hypothetical protein
MVIKIAARYSKHKINEKRIKQAEKSYRREKPENYSYGSRFQHIGLNASDIIQNPI